MENNNKKSWTEYFRIITPFLLVVLNGFGFLLYGKLTDMDNKLFLHLTNDQIHCPKEDMVSKGEFDIVSKFRDKQIDDIKDAIKYELQQMRIEIRNLPLYKDEYETKTYNKK